MGSTGLYFAQNCPDRPEIRITDVQSDTKKRELLKNPQKLKKSKKKKLLTEIEPL